MKILVCSLAISLAFLMTAGCGGEQQPREAQKQATEEKQKPRESPEAETVAPPQVSEVPAKEPPPQKPAPVSKPSVQKNMTVTGEVVDIVHYAASGTRADTPEGREVIESGAKRGNPLGILETGTGDVYLVTMKQASTPANPTLLPFLGMKVTAKGDVYRKGGQQLMVLSVVGKSIR
jgi:hypothetical protein